MRPNSTIIMSEQSLVLTTSSPVNGTVTNGCLVAAVGRDPPERATRSRVCGAPSRSGGYVLRARSGGGPCVVTACVRGADRPHCVRWSAPHAEPRAPPPLRPPSISPGRPDAAPTTSTPRPIKYMLLMQRHAQGQFGSRRPGMSTVDAHGDRLAVAFVAPRDDPEGPCGRTRRGGALASPASSSPRSSDPARARASRHPAVRSSPAPPGRAPPARPAPRGRPGPGTSPRRRAGRSGGPGAGPSRGAPPSRAPACSGPSP